MQRLLPQAKRLGNKCGVRYKVFRGRYDIVHVCGFNHHLNLNGNGRYYNILFFGSDEFSLPTLKKLHESYLSYAKDDSSSTVTHLEVVCPQDRPQGRGQHMASVPVKKYCLEHGIAFHHPNSLNTLKDWDIPKMSPMKGRDSIEHVNHEYDLAIAISFRYFIPSRIIKSFKVGAINVHPSLLPQYRGPAPIHWVLLNQEKETGITVQELDPNSFDTGRIISQIRVPIEPTIVYHQLYEKLSHMGAQCVMDLLEKKGRIENALLESIPQDVNQNFLLHDAPKITKNQGLLEFKKETCSAIYSKWKAFGDNIKVYTFINQRRLIFRGEMNALLDEEIGRGEIQNVKHVFPGTFHYQEGEDFVSIRCTDGWIRCSKLQWETEKEKQAPNFALKYMKSSLTTDV